MIEIAGRCVYTVADLCVGDKLPAPAEPGGYLEVFDMEKTTGFKGLSVSLMYWARDADEYPVSAPNIWFDYWEVGIDGDGCYTLTRPGGRPA